jgi:hypothetical protein
MVGLNAADSAFDTLQETGGSKDATLVSHNHTFSGTTSGVGNHQHGATVYSGLPTSPDGARFQMTDSLTVRGTAETNGSGAHDHTYSGTTSTQGSSATNANLQPYITVCMWLRTA